MSGLTKVRTPRRVLATLAALLALAVSAPALAVSSNELIEEPKKWDGREITYQGEVIGDVMRRGPAAVLNVNDGTYAMGVWVTVREADQIHLAGRYGVKGDVVLVHGVYHRACPAHGGDPDIHADRLVVLTPGRRLWEPFHRREAYGAAVLLLVALGLVVWERKRRTPPAGDGEL
jgi:hypothetical protein